MTRHGWEDLRPITQRTRPRKSVRRFRLEGGALCLASRQASYYIGSQLEGLLPLPLNDYPYLRIVAKGEQVPTGADLRREKQDDAALRVFAVERGLFRAWSMPGVRYCP